MHHRPPRPRPLLCSWNSLATYLTLALCTSSGWLSRLLSLSPPFEWLDCSLSPLFEWLTLSFQIQLTCNFEGVTFLDLSFHQSSSSSSGSFCVSCLLSVPGDTLAADESHACSLSVRDKTHPSTQHFCVGCGILHPLLTLLCIGITQRAL